MPLPIVFPNPFEDEDEINAAMMNALAAKLEQLASASPVPIEQYRGTMFHDSSVVIAGSTTLNTTFVTTGGVDVVYTYQDPGALNDEFKNGLYLSADTYTLKFDLWRQPDCGIISWYVDDVLVGSTDLYAASEGHHDASITSIVIVADGWHTIKGKVASKNASSSGYEASIFKMTMIGSLA